MVRPLSRILRRPVIHDTCVTVLFLVLGTLLAQLLNAALVNITNISFLYVLVVVFIARYTTSYLYGIIGSLLSIVCINFFLHLSVHAPELHNGWLSVCLSGHAHCLLYHQRYDHKPEKAGTHPRRAGKGARCGRK